MSNHLKSIEPLTIEAIRAWEWCGNAWSDGNAFDSIHQFATDPTKSWEDRAEAIHCMAVNGMGLTPEKEGIEGLTPQEQVETYLQGVR